MFGEERLHVGAGWVRGGGSCRRTRRRIGEGVAGGR